MSRWAAVALAAVVVLAGLAALVTGLGSLDSSQVAPVEGPGRGFANQCASHEAPPAGFDYNSRPPTSGPHRPRLVTGDGRSLGDDELLHALELGNVVLAYPGARAPSALRSLQRDVAGPFDAELAAAGQALILGRRADAEGIVALAWARQLQVSSARDPALREFAEHWLGKGARAAGGDCPGGA